MALKKREFTPESGNVDTYEYAMYGFESVNNYRVHLHSGCMFVDKSRVLHLQHVNDVSETQITVNII